MDGCLSPSLYPKYQFLVGSIALGAQDDLHVMWMKMCVCVSCVYLAKCLWRRKENARDLFLFRAILLTDVHACVGWGRPGRRLKSCTCRKFAYCELCGREWPAVRSGPLCSRTGRRGRVWCGCWDGVWGTNCPLLARRNRCRRTTFPSSSSRHRQTPATTDPTSNCFAAAAADSSVWRWCESVGLRLPLRVLCNFYRLA